MVPISQRCSFLMNGSSTIQCSCIRGGTCPLVGSLSQGAFLPPLRSTQLPIISTLLLLEALASSLGTPHSFIITSHNTNTHTLTMVEMSQIDPYQNTTNPYTGNETYDTLVVTMLSLRIGVMFVIFFLNLCQTVLEYQHLRTHRKPLSPRFMTFLSITLFPLCTQLLYTFFVSNAIILKNSKRAWHVAWAFSALLLTWYIIMWSLSKTGLDKIDRVSSLGNLGFIVLYGFIVIINGIVLIKLMRGQVEKIPRLQATITKTVKLASVLIVLVLVSTGSSLVFNFALHLDSYSNYRFISTFIVGLAEFIQVIVVMAALGGDSPRNYFLFKRVNDTGSSHHTSNGNGPSGTINKPQTSGGPSLSNTQSGFINREISLSSVSISSSPHIANRDGSAVSSSGTPSTLATTPIQPNQFNTSYHETIEDGIIINPDRPLTDSTSPQPSNNNNNNNNTSGGVSSLDLLNP
ncbi:hypothetical protein DFA_05222 [Cavenderia fasciculata]|uniref:Uncharacterized protein n=1 Tax=Cavenderia fasciculata TaxID=261658 RepID=F4PNN9_CACFS|nr:uncharacterized protein DFA_05222 [Cavenderia fasciculata]EGG23092.1 hypothetical protein DFA_05222 [Cavenderia fasciculata]|eukprot:XP_004360943.1 hypothetical protein DFA_05222 [Cavenderia fasciculata]